MLSSITCSEKYNQGAIFDWDVYAHKNCSTCQTVKLFLKRLQNAASIKKNLERHLQTHHMYSRFK